MGTRSDYYIKKGSEHEWVGSLEFDGDRVAHPKRMKGKTWRLDRELVATIHKARTPKAFRRAVRAFMDHEWNRLIDENYNPTSAVFYPEGGWPWLWPTSATTDYAYVFEDGDLRVFGYGAERQSYPWPVMRVGEPVPRRICLATGNPI